MSRSWLPMKDAELDTFCTGFSTKVTATPTNYGLVAADATALATLVAAYSAALALATDTTTRTSVNVAAKDVARAALVTQMRALYRKINVANISADRRLELGLPIRDGVPTVVPPPATRPIVTTVSVSGQEALLRLVDEATPLKRAEPEGTDGAIVLSYVTSSGEAAPTDPDKWAYKAVAKRSEVKVSFKPEQAGKLAYIRAFWVNPRGQAGPTSEPITMTIAA